MEQFINLLEQLTKIIQEDKTLDGTSFNLLSLVAIDPDKISQIKNETAGQEVSTIDEFWDLTEEIYKNLMLKTIAPNLQQYFNKVQLTSDQEWLKFGYTFSPWDRFEIRSEGIVNKPESDYHIMIHMELAHAENQIASFLDFLQIEDPTWYHGLYDFDYSFNFQSQVELLFHDLAFSCWQETKKETGATISGFIAESNGGSYTFSLDTGHNLHELNLSITEYLAQ